MTLNNTLEQGRTKKSLDCPRILILNLKKNLKYGANMQIHQEQLEGNVYKINLQGRMDIPGTQEIDLKFSGMTAAPRKSIIVDFSGVDFLASIGIRTLLVNTKSVNNRGGKLVILNPDANIKKILLMAGIDTLIPIFNNLDSALAAVNQIGSS
jgi:anti-sigma B factor antagonist